MAVLAVGDQDYGRLLIERRRLLYLLLLLPVSPPTVQDVEGPHEKETREGHRHTAGVEDVGVLARAVH